MDFGGKGRRYFGPRDMYDVTCSECGKEAQVPFRPSSEKHIVCRDCFAKRAQRYEDARRAAEDLLRNKTAPAPESIAHQLHDFECSGILGPDGRPLAKGIEVPKPIVEAVCEVNDELIAALKSDPSLLYDLRPRKFEQVVAELLKRQGYQVEPTPYTRDGGFDMYAAKTEGLGHFVYLVECKRYDPSHKVRVAVVRDLYGVVQERRANGGVIVTTSSFTKPAQEFQSTIKYQLQLKDYIALKNWLSII